LRAYAALKGFVISSRDAKSAYLQRNLKRPGTNDPTTWIALPKQFQPAGFEKFKNPVVELVLSLYGHPAAGNRWEGTMDGMVRKVGFQKATQWKAIYKEPKTEAGLGVYVDDFELVASPEDTPKIWKALEGQIEFGDEHHVWEGSHSRHLGCQYNVKRELTREGQTIMSVRASMEDYFKDIVRRFEQRMQVKVKDAETPWLD
jgi:hypothetical protein